MDSNILNKVYLLEKDNKPIAKLPELEINQPYTIIAGTTTKFGKIFLLKLEDCVVFLPVRVTETYKPFPKIFKEQRFWLICKGAKLTKKPNPAFIFGMIEK